MSCIGGYLNGTLRWVTQDTCGTGFCMNITWNLGMRTAGGITAEPNYHLHRTDFKLLQEIDHFPS